MARMMGVWGMGGGFSTGGLGAHAQDMLESLAEWFHATEYIFSVLLAFRDLRRRIVVVFSN